VAVAKLAGLPESVLARAHALLGTLEAGGHIEKAARRGEKRKNEDQLELFGSRGAEDRTRAEVIDTLRMLDVDRMTGLEALQLISRLKTKL
jgi:DNA mismatch repair protein MutS